MLEAPAGRGKIAMLVISPTRELAAQIAEEAKQLTKHQNLAVQVGDLVTGHPHLLPFLTTDTQCCFTMFPLVVPCKSNVRV